MEGIKAQRLAGNMVAIQKLPFNLHYGPGHNSICVEILVALEVLYLVLLFICH